MGGRRGRRKGEGLSPLRSPVTIVSRQPITLAISQFEDIVSRGLRSLIEDEQHLRLLAADIPSDRLAQTFGEHSPEVCPGEHSPEHG